MRIILKKSVVIGHYSTHQSIRFVQTDYCTNSNLPKSAVKLLIDTAKIVSISKIMQKNCIFSTNLPSPFLFFHFI